MKKIILSASILFFSITHLSAQDNTNCYQKYAEVFEVRGANEVIDGTYDDVIITIRKRGFADCFVGKVSVKGGRVILSSMQLSFVDNTFEPFVRNYKNSNEPITIIGGISKTLLTKDEELINVIFTSSLKPKKKAFKRAPEPIFD